MKCPHSKWKKGKNLRNTDARVIGFVYDSPSHQALSIEVSYLTIHCGFTGTGEEKCKKRNNSKNIDATVMDLASFSIRSGIVFWTINYNADATDMDYGKSLWWCWHRQHIKYSQVCVCLTKTGNTKVINEQIQGL